MNNLASFRLLSATTNNRTILTLFHHRTVSNYKTELHVLSKIVFCLEIILLLVIILLK